MASNDQEIEIKLPLLNKDAVIAFLQQHATCTAQDMWQKDTYYVPSHRDFLSVPYPYEWLRVRESSKGTFVNYKHFYPENAAITDYCDEFETKVENGESIKKIFTHLQIEPIVIVEKVRSTRTYKEVEIALDHVTDLGSYIELESMTYFTDPQAGRAYLHSILAEIGAQVGAEDYRGYPFLVLQAQGYTFAQEE